MATSTPTGSKGISSKDNETATFLQACLDTIDPPPKINYQAVADLLGIVSAAAAQKRHYRLQKTMKEEGGPTPKKAKTADTNGDDATPTKPKSKAAATKKATPAKKKAAEDAAEEQTPAKKVKEEDEVEV